MVSKNGVLSLVSKESEMSGVRSMCHEYSIVNEISSKQIMVLQHVYPHVLPRYCILPATVANSRWKYPLSYNL